MLLALLLALSIGFQTAEPAVTVARAYDAFNAHDATRFAGLVAEDVHWFTVTKDGVKTEIAGRDALKDYLGRYFRTTPGVRSRIESSFAVGAHVAIHERVTWQTRRGERSQSAMAVYEVIDGRITRVWYYEQAIP